MPNIRGYSILVRCDSTYDCLYVQRDLRAGRCDMVLRADSKQASESCCVACDPYTYIIARADVAPFAWFSGCNARL